MRIWPWSKIADLEAELGEAIEHIYFLEEVIEENQQTCQQARMIMTYLTTPRVRFPMSGIGEA